MLEQIVHFLFGSDPSASPHRRRRGVVARRKPNCKPPRVGPSKRRPKAGRNAAPNRRAGPLPGTITVYHGTPTREAARSIVTHGWVVGMGNLLGDGVYVTTSPSVARGYSGQAGYLIKARLRPGKCADWSAGQNKAFAAWCAARRCPADNSARTAFLLERGYRTLRKGNVFVVLQRGYRNPSATKVRLNCFKIMGVIEAGSGRRVSV